MENIGIKPELNATQKIRTKKLSLMLKTASDLLRQLYAPDVDGIVDETGQLGRAKVRLWILTGIVLNQYAKQAQRSLRQIHGELTVVVPKISMSAVHRSMAIADHFGNIIEKFDEWYAHEHVHDTLTGVYNTIFQIKKVTLKDEEQNIVVNPYVKALEAIDEMQKYAMLSDRNYQEYGSRMNVLRSYIEARIPVAFDFEEDTFFRHSPCCICKAGSRTEAGWELYTVTVEQIELLVPVCPACLHRTEQVNWIQVAHMYYLYSLVAQNEINKYTNTSEVQMLSPGTFTVEM